MPREATITQEQVNAAADAIRASGSKPTARAIRDHLGTGSMATVLKFLQVWQSGQVKPTMQDVALPPALNRVLVDFIGQEVAQARAGLEADLVMSQQQQADLIAESERQAATIEAQATALEQTQADKAELQGKLGQMEVDLATARDEATRERQAAESARTELAKAQLRLDALPRIEAEANRLREGLDAERHARTEAEQNAAVLASKLDAAEKRLAHQAEQFAEARKFAAQEAHRVAERLVKAEADRDEARHQAWEAREKLARCTGELQVFERQEAARLSAPGPKQEQP